MIMRPILEAIEAEADLFGPFEQIVRDVSRMYSQYADVNAARAPVDLSATEHEATVELELPGVDPAALELEVENKILTVRADRRDREPEGEVHYLRRERPQGPFQRSVPLPFDVEASEVKAAYKNGLLRVHLPRAEASKPRKITVES